MRKETLTLKVSTLKQPEYPLMSSPL